VSAAGIRQARRVAVISDVHGNAVALEAVLAEVGESGADAIVFGGDITWGPLPHETAELIRGLPDVLLVRGNADRAVLEAVAGVAPEPRDRWMAAAHQPEDVELLRGCLPSVTVTVDGLGPVRFCHGSPRSDEECVTPRTPEERMRALSEGMTERVLVTAHIHVSFDRDIAGLRSINPGSVGLPYEGAPGAYWAVLGPGGVEFRRTAYDLDRALERYRATDDPGRDVTIEMLLDPAPRDYAIDAAEAAGFAG
jgi:predicted phosphodiesterase